MKAKFKSKRTAGIVAIERKKRELQELVQREAAEVGRLTASLQAARRAVVKWQNLYNSSNKEYQTILESHEELNSFAAGLRLQVMVSERAVARLTREKENLSETITVQTSRIHDLTTGLEDCRLELNRVHAYLKDTQHKLSVVIDDKQYFKRRVSHQLSKAGRELDRAKTRTLTCTIWAAGGWLLALGYFGAYLGLWG